ncbi:RNA polymerase sigma factor SigM [Mycobacterium montefiorense]|uniref:ECF RNA polymerase sigma factor SigM n=1 Tax=Mycobacterium montefiorense TaxID=154654 RepID=A0AA37UWK6_9MYCO|nr:RNA polymerase sigma factor SigM [Mycobacterium montefiorense]GBG40993.1 ECF RNA polymerase sigma factor SigM [Mycobacterium montefiorense]GKU35095.1 ECF RNA polymerase sigma factor SigM [Mycobacterium montefiorense]GKU41220.1 ECF RNA polymerase sigma factor SigM [Mycobacterium montefiorense]GKU47840.1 ECF RNA polymerase sigma factor SigM [Mycobacterium montefiorense]GKU49497.1 ECF RNA polymerase sigma factor SigM [Mycobacterium montefiorense]
MGIGGYIQQERSDAELLAAHVAGDRHAFGELFVRHRRQLHRLARLTTRSPEDAEDALQDAMLSAHRGAGTFRYDAAVGSWLHRIVVNACLDRLRRTKSHRTEPLEDVYPVADRTAQVETAMLVQHALMRLPVEQRATIVAVDMQGYSIADTALLLGIAEGTVKSRCARARVRLAQLLGYLDAGAHTTPDHPAGQR